MKITDIMSAVVAFAVSWACFLLSANTPGGVGQPVAPEPPEELTSTLDELNDNSLDEAAEDVAKRPSLETAGDTCLMRYRLLDFSMSRDRREKFGVAALLNAPEKKRAQLEGLIEGATLHEAWRIHIALARLALRTGDQALANIHLDQAEGIDDIPAVCRSDVAFLRAAANPENAIENLLVARTLDPGSWQSNAQLAKAIVEHMPRSTKECDKLTSELIVALVQMSHLAVKDVDLGYLMRSVEQNPNSGRAALLEGMILERTGQFMTALDFYEQELEASGPYHCGHAIDFALKDRIAALERRPLSNTTGAN
jgi:tetratricopeptide (TPR) repeat protein